MRDYLAQPVDKRLMMLAGIYKRLINYLISKVHVDGRLIHFFISVDEGLKNKGMSRHFQSV